MSNKNTADFYYVDLEYITLNYQNIKVWKSSCLKNFKSLLFVNSLYRYCKALCERERQRHRHRDRDTELCYANKPLNVVCTDIA